MSAVSQHNFVASLGESKIVARRSRFIYGILESAKCSKVHGLAQDSLNYLFLMDKSYMNETDQQCLSDKGNI